MQWGDKARSACTSRPDAQGIEKKGEQPNLKADTGQAGVRRGWYRRQGRGCGCGPVNRPEHPAASAALPGPAARRLHERSVAATSRPLAVVSPAGHGRSAGSGEQGDWGGSSLPEPGVFSPNSALIAPSPEGAKESRWACFGLPSGLCV